MYGSGFNQQMYLSDLQNMRDRIDRQMQQVGQVNPSQTPQINQNFQLAPSNNGIKYVNGLSDVEKELVFLDTLFVDKGFTTMWFKNAAGDIKTYELKEKIIIDEKDQKIAELMDKIAILEKEVNKNAGNDYENVNVSTSESESTNVSNDKSSKK